METFFKMSTCFYFHWTFKKVGVTKISFFSCFLVFGNLPVRCLDVGKSVATPRGGSTLAVSGGM